MNWRSLLQHGSAAVAALALAAPSTGVATPIPDRFDIVCSSPLIANGKKVMDVKWLRTIDLKAGKWCESTCDHVDRFGRSGDALVLFEQADRGGGGAQRMTFELHDLTIHHDDRDASGATHWTERCRLKPFSGFRPRPPPF